MTETNRIEFKRELTEDLDIEKEIKMLLCTGCFLIDWLAQSQGVFYRSWTQVK